MSKLKAEDFDGHIFSMVSIRCVKCCDEETRYCTEDITFAEDLVKLGWKIGKNGPICPGCSISKKKKSKKEKSKKERRGKTKNDR